MLRRALKLSNNKLHQHMLVSDSFLSQAVLLFPDVCRKVGL